MSIHTTRTVSHHCLETDRLRISLMSFPKLTPYPDIETNNPGLIIVIARFYVVRVDVWQFVGWPLNVGMPTTVRENQCFR